jgi:D-alanyl-D-alanine carboxypeptidase
MPVTVTSAKTETKPETKSDSKPDSKSATKGKPETKSAPPAFALASASSMPFALSAAKPEPKSEAKPEAKPEAKSGPLAYAVASAASVPVTLTSKSDPGASTTVQVPRWAATNSAPAPTPRTAPAVGSEDPIHPVLVKTVMVKPGSSVQTASLAPLQLPAPAEPAPVTTQTIAAAPAPVKAALPFPPPGTRPGAIGGLPSRVTTGSVADAAPAAATAPTTAVQVAAAPAAPPPSPAPAPVATRSATPQTQHVGWIIQVGAFPAEGEAKQRLSSVQSKASKFLASADAFTETVNKGESTMYRARFAGLGKDQAEAACNYLKHNDVDCMTIKN